jgi:hypothetical protein
MAPMWKSKQIVLGPYGECSFRYDINFTWMICKKKKKQRIHFSTKIAESVNLGLFQNFLLYNSFKLSVIPTPACNYPSVYSVCFAALFCFCFSERMCFADLSVWASITRKTC